MPDSVPVAAAANPDRREFLRSAIAMPAALGLTISATAWLSGCSREAAVAQGYKVLRPQDLPMLARLLPAVVGPVVPTEPAARAAAVQQLVQSYDQLLADTSPAVRSLFLPLLDLPTMGLTRGPLFGLWQGWDEASDADALAFLERWADSKTEFMRGAYNGLNATATMAWYLDAAHGADAGYPGPPRKIVAAVAPAAQA